MAKATYVKVRLESEQVQGTAITRSVHHAQNIKFVRKNMTHGLSTKRQVKKACMFISLRRNCLLTKNKF